MEGLTQDISSIIGKDPISWLINPKVIVPAAIPVLEFTPVLKRHQIILKAVSDSLPADEFVFITSTSVDYSGKKRTLSNGSNHVNNQGLDFIIVTKKDDGTYHSLRSFPYSRSVLVIMMVAIALSKGYIGRVCLEDDHIHVHHSDVFTGVLQMVSGKNKHNENSTFLCSGHSTPYLHIDITSFTKLIASKNFSTK